MIIKAEYIVFSGTNYSCDISEHRVVAEIVNSSVAINHIFFFKAVHFASSAKYRANLHLKRSPLE